ncbi:O-antigen ligase family protein [uncultured Methylobacterium sp.]|uniref:O-antigen ligase family protein n=1 Tax=uncultured Methylobacterium sp. TaxID=157278 RepID=UPI0035CA38DB
MRVAEENAGSSARTHGAGAPMVATLTRLDKICLLVIGLALQFNVETSTFGLPFQRLSDLIPFLTIPYFLLRPGVMSAILSRLVPIGLVVALLGASLVFKAGKQEGDVYLTLVLLLYFVQCVQLVILFRDPSGPAWFSSGILIGMIGSLGALIAASVSIDLAPYGLAVPLDGVDPEIALFMQDKLGGLWTAGNMTGHVFALTGAAAMYLWFRYRRTEIYVLYVLGLLASFPMTNNRAGLLVPLVCLALLVRRSVNALYVACALAVLCGLVMVFGATGHVPVPEQFQSAIEKRFLSDGNTESNIGERLDTTVAALRMIVANPFGIGAIATQNQLREMTGLGTPHNGILSLAIQSGVMVALLFVLGAGRILLRPARFGPFAYYVVLFTVPSLMFEELSINQFFLFFMAFVLAASALAGSAEADIDHRPAALSARVLRD